MKNMKVCFIHPDLGIGGAERLVVDAALGAKALGHDVVIYTSHHDRHHAFEETIDGTLKVVVYGDFLPRALLGRFLVFFAILRNIYLSLVILFSWSRFDVVFCDQISVCIPILKLTGAKTLFYCHFPDKLLSSRQTLLKRLYRIPFDYIEERTTAMADKIVVNSKFTAKTFRDSFPTIQHTPSVLYPAINTMFFSSDPHLSLSSPLSAYQTSQKKIILSINRFEVKKDITLAIQAFATFRSQLSPKDASSFQLVIAGGYDPRVVENINYLNHLKVQATSLKLSYKVILRDAKAENVGNKILEKDIIFLPSFTEEHKLFLLKHSFCLLYTPSNEHFGIVPCEAMYCKLPVIAVNNGGPTESMVDGVTGLLLESNAGAFANGLLRMHRGEVDCQQLGEAGYRRVKENFSLESFSVSLGVLLKSFAKQKKVD